MHRNFVASDMRMLEEQLEVRPATVLAVVGLHGAYVVARRTREVGIRMALGAARGSVIHLVMREMLLAPPTGKHTARAAADKFIAGMFAPGGAALPAAALAAAFVPAWRASRIHPMRALRYE